MGGQISLYVNRIRPELISKTILLCSSSYLARNLTFTILFLFTVLSFIRKELDYTARIVHNLMNVVHDHSLIDDEMKKVTPLLL